MNMKVLEEMGLTKNEIKVYLALLTSGRSTSWTLTKKTSIQVSALYYCLENLIKKGLVSYSVSANKKHFEAASPDQLISIIEQKKKDIQSIVPELKALEKKSIDRIETKVYEGYKGFKGIYDRLLKTLKKGDEYYVFGARQIGDESNITLNSMLTGFHKQRDKRGIQVKIIFNKDVKEEVKSQAKKLKHMSYKFSDSITNSFTLMYDNRVIDFLYSGRLIAIETISKDVYDSYVKFFRELWKIGKK